MSDHPESDRLGEFPHPRETAELVGQQEAEHALFDTFMSGRMHHAWLIAGPKGIGKATLAYRLARFLLHYPTPEHARIAKATNLSVSQDDDVSRQIAAQSHPNLLVLRRPYDEKAKRLKTVITVEEVRRTSHFFGMSAGADGWRVAIIDPADDLNVNAENALLKVLEEPPARSIFLLVSHQPGRLLPTIRSRCRMLTLKPLSEPDIAAVLSANDTETKAAERLAIAQLADGSAGRALAIASGGGLGLYRDLTALLMALPRLNVKALHKLADEVGKRGADEAYETFTELLLDWLQRLIRNGAGLPPTAEIVPGEAAAMARLAGSAALDRWVEVWEKISQSIVRAEELNTDRKLVILNIFSMLESLAGERVVA